jgi:hypothetical protein
VYVTGVSGGALRGYLFLDGAILGERNQCFCSITRQQERREVGIAAEVENLNAADVSFLVACRTSCVCLVFLGDVACSVVVVVVV